MFIQDPRNGNTMQVNKEGHGQVNAIITSNEVHHADVHGSAFAAGNPAITMDASDNVVLHIQNTSTTDLLYVQTTFASHNLDAKVLVSFYKGSTYSSGGTSFTPASLNLSKNITAPATAYYGNDMTVTGGTQIAAGYINDFSEIKFGGALILGSNDTLDLRVNGAVGTAAVGIRFFYHGGSF